MTHLEQAAEKIYESWIFDDGKEATDELWDLALKEAQQL